MKKFNRRRIRKFMRWARQHYLLMFASHQQFFAEVVTAYAKVGYKTTMWYPWSHLVLYAHDRVDEQNQPYGGKVPFLYKEKYSVGGFDKYEIFKAMYSVDRLGPVMFDYTIDEDEGELYIHLYAYYEDDIKNVKEAISEILTECD